MLAVLDAFALAFALFLNANAEAIRYTVPPSTAVDEGDAPMFLVFLRPLPVIVLLTGLLLALVTVASVAGRGLPTEAIMVYGLYDTPPAFSAREIFNGTDQLDEYRQHFLYAFRRGLSVPYFVDTIVFNPRPAYDGRIAYRVGTPTGLELDVIDWRSTAPPIRIAGAATGTYLWSPDGALLFYSAVATSGGVRLYLWDGVRSTDITPPETPALDAVDALHWLPDNRLVFQVRWGVLAGGAAAVGWYRWDGRSVVAVEAAPAVDGALAATVACSREPAADGRSSRTVSHWAGSRRVQIAQAERIFVWLPNSASAEVADVQCVG